jgi:hypothetical protein
MLKIASRLKKKDATAVAVAARNASAALTRRRTIEALRANSGQQPTLGAQVAVRQLAMAVQSATGHSVRANPKYRHLFTASGGCIPPPKPFMGLTHAYSASQAQVSATAEDKYIYVRGASAWKEISLPASTKCVVWTNPYSYGRPLKTSTAAGAITTTQDWGNQPAVSDGVDYGFTGDPAAWATPNPLMLFHATEDIKAGNYAAGLSTNVQPQKVQWMGGFLELQLDLPYNGLATSSVITARSCKRAMLSRSGIVVFALPDAISPETLALTHGQPQTHVGSAPSASSVIKVPLEHDSRWFLAGEFDSTDAPAGGNVSVNQGLFPRNHVVEMARGFIYISNSSSSAITIRTRMRGTFAIVPLADDSTTTRNPLMQGMLRRLASCGPHTPFAAFDSDYTPHLLRAERLTAAAAHSRALQAQGLPPSFASRAATYHEADPEIGHVESKAVEEVLDGAAAASGGLALARLTAKASGSNRAISAIDAVENFGLDAATKAWDFASGGARSLVKGARSLLSGAADAAATVAPDALALL